jgi:hypothetical protein
VRGKRGTRIELASSPWKGEALPLSYPRTREPCSQGCSPTMTVCTNDVAGVDLVENRLPPTVAQTCGDVEVLVPEVIELEHERVGLAAVDAGSRAKELDEICGALGDERLFPAHRIGHVALAVRRIMLAFVSRSAGAAVVVSLTAGPSAPSEVRERLGLSATAADSGRLGGCARHEHMFPS